MNIFDSPEAVELRKKIADAGHDFSTPASQGKIKCSRCGRVYTEETVSLAVLRCTPLKLIQGEKE